MGGYTGAVTVTAKVWYQSAPPRWMEEMFAYNTAEIDTFRTMYEAADGTPVLVKEQSIVDVSLAVDDIRESGLRIFPNPVRDGLLRIEGITERIEGIEVFDLRGSLLSRYTPNGQHAWQVVLPKNPGTYLVVVNVGGRRLTQRVVAY